MVELARFFGGFENSRPIRHHDSGKTFQRWVPEGSLAMLFGRHETARELVCGAGFSWWIPSLAGPPGPRHARIFEENLRSIRHHDSGKTF